MLNSFNDMKKQRTLTLWLFAAVTSLALNLFAGPTNDPAAPATYGVITNGFSAPFFYAPPNQNQLKTLLSGAEASLQTNGEVRLRDVQLKTFAVDGSTQAVIHTPECFYNPVTQSARSAGHIEVHSGDGKSMLEGTGFYWRQADSTLVISNRVRTVLPEVSKNLLP
jgi:hypothetical protein